MGRQIDRHLAWMDGQIEKQSEVRQLDRQTDRQIDRQLDRQIARYRDRQIDGYIDRKKDRQTDRRIDGQIDAHTHIYIQRERKRERERKKERETQSLSGLSVHQWVHSDIQASQQQSFPIGFLSLKLPPPLCAVLLVKPYWNHFFLWLAILTQEKSSRDHREIAEFSDCPGCSVI